MLVKTKPEISHQNYKNYLYWTLNKNTPMAPTILQRGLPICGLRPNHVCEVSR
jgi:hypothetical protein